MKTVRYVLLVVAVWLLSIPAAGQASAAERKLEEVIIVCKTHFDIGYTDLARNVVQRYRTSMIDNALRIVDESRRLPPEQRFIWTLSGWPMQQVLWPGQELARRQRVGEAIREGRLVWHALPASLHTESLDLEDLVRGMDFSSALARQFGQPLPRDAKMTDVPSHTWVLATILKRAGVDFMHIGCNGGSGSPELPLLFWWEGPDGSRLLTMYSRDYGTGLHPPADWPYKTWLALMVTGDNHGPPTPDEVQGMLGQARRELPGVKIRMGRMSDFADAILREKPSLPVVRADLSDTWIQGIMSMPIETHLARNLRPAIAAYDSLNTLLTAWGVKTPPCREAVAAAYEGSLMYGEHTWGYDAKQFPRLYGKAWQEAEAAGRYALLEESWGEKAAYVKKPAGQILPAMAQNMEALAKATNGIVVFNPLPWPRDGLVTLTLGVKPPQHLKDVASGEIVSCEPTRSGVIFTARQVPSLGYRTYVPVLTTPVRDEGAGREKARVRLTRDKLESAFFRLRLDAARGVVVSLVDKRSGRELVDPKLGSGLGQYIYERFDADDAARFVKSYCKYVADWVLNDFAKPGLPPASEVPHRTASPEKFTLKVHRGPVADVAELTAAASEKVPHAVTLRVTLPHDQPYVDFEWEVAGKKPDPWPEAGWLAFPLAIDQPTFRLGRLGSVVDPAKDICRSANFDNFCLNTGLNVLGRDGSGVGICPIDSPLVSLGQPGMYRYTRSFEPRKPVVLVNLFANVFGTNFQQWIGGSWSCRVRLWSAAGKDLTDDLIAPAWEARCPLQAAWSDGPAGSLPPSQSGLELSRRGVLVTAFGPNPEGDGLLLLLWEQSGKDGPCRVLLPASLRDWRVQPCDLRGQPAGEPIQPRDGFLDVPLTHFAPASMVLRPR
jgi:hypothetical protein